MFWLSKAYNTLFRDVLHIENILVLLGSEPPTNSDLPCFETLTQIFQLQVIQH